MEGMATKKTGDSEPGATRETVPDDGLFDEMGARGLEATGLSKER
jgi:hypothetical protein